MTADELSGYKEMSSVSSSTTEESLDIDKYRKLIRNFIDLVRIGIFRHFFLIFGIN